MNLYYEWVLNLLFLSNIIYLVFTLLYESNAKYFLLLHSGFFEEIKTVGLHTVNVSGGLSGMNLTPMGKCTCGIQDTIEEDNEKRDESQTTVEDYLLAGDHEQKSYLRGSLFQKDYGDEQGTCKERKCSYNLDWDSHLQTCTEETMLGRTAAVAVDLLYHLELPDDVDSEHLSIISGMS